MYVIAKAIESKMDARARAKSEEWRTREIKFTCQMLTMDGIEDQNVAHSQIASFALALSRSLAAAHCRSFR